ncbi:MAG: peptidylprolyl isomerase [Firmicutes bacterium]|nr:peptidylprolyl isomerase [Dethiobacter sp.]MBS3888188.1 peptidylprolyl isomerase [Bacillota bacterium]MBS4053204.1 peptidylprolyl isomerase [Thermaerobacter sp.]
MSNKQIATIATEKGNFTVELFAQHAPGTVENFTKLAKAKFYDGLTFHRCIPDFVIQGGCPEGTGRGGPGYHIKCETAGNPHKHVRGALSMAHAGKDTGGSQFFVVRQPQPHLDGKHTVFGQVTDNVDLVDAIAEGDKIISVTIHSS